jgi:hypothetical protein
MLRSKSEAVIFEAASALVHILSINYVDTGAYVMDELDHLYHHHSNHIADISQMCTSFCARCSYRVQSHPCSDPSSWYFQAECKR